MPEHKTMEKVTIKDIAKKCGVAVSTVSRAMNNHPDINPETKAMIDRVMKECNYVPNNSARQYFFQPAGKRTGKRMPETGIQLHSAERRGAG